MSLAKKLKVGFVWWSSHRFNLAVTELLKNHQDTISLVRYIMHKMKYGINAARLRKKMPLGEIGDQTTRWSSCYNMLKIFNEIKYFIKSCGIYHVTKIVPNAKQSMEIYEICKRHDQLDSITKELHKEDISLSLVWACFYEAIAFCPDKASRLKGSLEIVLQPDFESAIRKKKTKINVRIWHWVIWWLWKNVKQSDESIDDKNENDDPNLLLRARKKTFSQSNCA